jgi:hypothetical protein
MTHSKTIFAAAALVGVGVTFAALVAAPFNAPARAAASQSEADIVAERIGGAFATMDLDAKPVRATKGDLFAAADCDSQTWPDIPARCLSSADGAPVQEARFVTVGYQTGDAETVLVRMSSSSVATR